VEEEGKDKGMNTSNLELGSILRKTYKNSRNESKKEEGSVERNEKAHYIFYGKYKVL
jgi:hypothetical protein